MIDLLFTGGADDTNDRHHLTNTGKNNTSKLLPIAHPIQERGSQCTCLITFPGVPGPGTTE